jgi:hypothetical protein
MMAERNKAMPRIVFRRSLHANQSAASSLAETAASGGTMAAAGASTLAVATAAMWRGTQEGETDWRPINAISHIVWGSGAADQREFTMRYTVSGLILNAIACGFWAWMFRLWLRQGRSSFVRSAGRALGISALAYVTDYYVVPRRFTPGFELCLSRRSFPWIYGALVVGLLFPQAVTSMRQLGHQRRRRHAIGHNGGL